MTSRSDIPPIDVTAHTYRVSPFPTDSEAGKLWAAWIKSDNHGRWLVSSAYSSVPEEYLTRDGWWTFQKGDDTLYSFEDAEKLAREAVTKIVVNGIDIHGAVKREVPRRGHAE
jgi:hypothetical protein